MVRRIVSLVALCAFVNCGLGCTAQSVVPKDELLETRGGRGKIIDARLRSMEIVRFDDEGGMLDTIAGTVTGVTREGTPVELNCDDIDRLCVQRDSTGRTVLLVVAVGVLTAMVVGVLYFGELYGDQDLLGSD